MTTLLTFIPYIGYATILGAFLYIGRKLQILDDLKATSDKIKANVKVISDHLTLNSKSFNPSELQTYSPLRLTDEGEKLIRDTHFDTIFDEHRNRFFGYITDEKPKLKYDVEAAAIRSISEFSDEEFMSFLKVFFYNNPSRNLDNTAPTFGVYIRDEYLEAHPEITE